jgi:hypothetical protein
MFHIAVNAQYTMYTNTIYILYNIFLDITNIRSNYKIYLKKTYKNKYL